MLLGLLTSATAQFPDFRSLFQPQSDHRHTPDRTGAGPEWTGEDGASGHPR